MSNASVGNCTKITNNHKETRNITKRFDDFVFFCVFSWFQSNNSRKLLLSFNKLRLTSSRLRLTSSRLRLTSSRLTLTSSRLALASNKLRLASSRLALASSRLALASCRLALASSRLGLASSRLGLASSRLALASGFLLLAHQRGFAVKSRLLTFACGVTICVGWANVYCLLEIVTVYVAPDCRSWIL